MRSYIFYQNDAILKTTEKPQSQNGGQPTTPRGGAHARARAHTNAIRKVISYFFFNVIHAAREETQRNTCTSQKQNLRGLPPPPPTPNRSIIQQNVSKTRNATITNCGTIHGTARKRYRTQIDITHLSKPATSSPLLNKMTRKATKNHTTKQETNTKNPHTMGATTMY